jgi:hypothetical protein
LGKFWVAILVSAVFFISSFLVLYHQYGIIGIWFEIEDINHELIAVAFTALGLGILVGATIIADKNPT